MHARSQAHRRLSTLNLADGGFVENLKQKFGFGGPPESMTEKFARQDRERAAKVAARGPAPTAATAPVPPPASAPEPEQEDKREAAAARLGGLNLDAIKRREQAAGLKHGGTVPKQGGVIRGPGTGRSDSIPAKMKPGSFVLPADSTKRLSDVRVSNGESSFPPGMVQRIGAAALLAMRDVTHLPATGRRGAQRLEGGGEVEQQKPNSFGDAAAAANDAGVTQIGASPSVSTAMSEAASAPARAGMSAPTSMGSGGGNSFGDAAAASQDSSVRQIGPSPASEGSGSSPGGGGAVFGIYPQTSSTRSTYATDNALRTGVQADGPSSFSPARPAADPGQMRMDNYSDPRSTQYGQQPGATGTPSSAPSSSYADAGSGRGSLNPPSADPSASAPSASPAPREDGKIYRSVGADGSVSYSGTGTVRDGASIVGGTGGGGSISPRNESAANTMDARERLASVGRVEAGGGGTASGADGRSLGSQVGWAGDPKNPQVYVKTAEDRLGTYGGMNITPGMYSDKFGRAALESRLGREQSAINAGQTDATNRYATDSAAATARAGNALTAQRNTADQALASKKFGLDSQAAGLDARSKMNSLKAQDAYLNAKSPQERALAQSSLQAMSGHPPAPKFTVLKGEKTADGQSPDYAINNNTGEFLQPPQSRFATPPERSQMVKNQTYQTARGPAVWDGSKFVAR